MTSEQKQCLLRYLGYYVGNIDGDFGTLSKTATEYFQRDAGLDPDGVCGAQTEKALKEAVYKGMPSKVTESVQSDDFWGGIKYLKREEFRCQCGGKYCNGYPAEPDKTLVKLGDKVRTHFGKPLRRSSGLRCKTWNTLQGGIANSRHMSGKALDFRIEGKNSQQVLEYVQKQPECRYAYAIDDTWVHMDVE